MTLLLLYIPELIKMKTLFVIAVLTCFFAMGMTQTDCANQAIQAANCVGRLGMALAAAGGDNTRFCNDCKTPLNHFFQACPTAAGVDTAGLQRGK